MGPGLLAALLISAAPSVAVAQPLLGIAYGNQGWEMAHVEAQERWQGRKNDIVLVFTSWEPATHLQDNLFTRQLTAVWANGSVPLITWEPFTGRTTPADIVGKIAKGDFDGYVRQWAGRLRVFLAGADGAFGTGDDRRVFLRPAHEMNGNWYPWGQRSPVEFIAMWRRVHGHFTAAGLGAAHVQWVWSVTNVDQGAVRAEDYFPGDDWVDWVGLDGYNWGTTRAWSRWQSPEETFGPMLARLRERTRKPLALTEVGTTNVTAEGVRVDAKNTWIGQLFTWLPTSGVRMLCWFNIDRDANFAVFGGHDGDALVPAEPHPYNAYSEYHRRVAALSVPGTPGPRLISDERFAGQ